MACALSALLLLLLTTAAANLAEFESNAMRLEEDQQQQATNKRPTVLLAERSGRRNHGCAFVDDTRLIEVLGRWAESVEEMTLETTATPPHYVPTAQPAQRISPCAEGCDLNHVVAVLVNETEIWLPCGFEGHRVGNESSTLRSRVVDAATLRVRRGPELPVPGGACAALAVPFDDDVAVCSFGGTDGSHDDGTFLKAVNCYDRSTEKWFAPFGPLPLGVDHANAVLLPAGLCDSGDPAKVLLLNFRTEHFANMRTEIFVADVPAADDKSPWGLFSNDTSSLPRDASGVALVGKFVVQFGGVFYAYGDSRQVALRADADARDLANAVGALTSGPIRAQTRGWHVRVDFSEIRALDVCGSRRWVHAGRLHTPRFATQTCRSRDLVVTCGGRPGGRNAHGSGRDRQNMRGCELHRVDHLNRQVLSALRRTEKRRQRKGEDADTRGRAVIASLLTQRHSQEDVVGHSSSFSRRLHDDDDAPGRLQEAMLANYGRQKSPRRW